MYQKASVYHAWVFADKATKNKDLDREYEGTI